jgi:glucose-1-phosphate cytidylyltransferase
VRVVLFCGGLGLRMRTMVDDHGTLQRRAADAPKPMSIVGDRPLLWHIMKWYAHYGHHEFVLCLGHRGDVITDWFLSLNHSGVTEVGSAVPALRLQLDEPGMEGWTVTLVNTGPDAVIGQRLRMVREFVDDQEVFLANYADGLSDVSLPEMISLHESSGAVATFMAAPLASSLHAVAFSSDDTHVDSIGPLESKELWINGGFFVLRSEIFDYLNPGEELVVEPFARLIQENRLVAMRYHGFWVALDTAKDRFLAEQLWASSRPWAVWQDEQALLPAQSVGN